MTWTSEQTEFVNCLRSRQTEVWLDRSDPSHLEIMAEQGSGHCRESITTNIPIEYLVQLMEHAGFRVDYPSEEKGGVHEVHGA